MAFPHPIRVGLAVLAVASGLIACSRSETPTVSPPPATTTAASITTTFIMPNLVGRFWPDAEPLLRSLGWIGALVKGPDVAGSGVELARIVTQQPAAGTRTPSDTAITLRFAA